jgi:threonylcarbamoyladenosine tRNA methylthiotransferase MtaB
VRRLARHVTIDPAVATFTVDFLGCKVSHVDAHDVREALLRDGHTESPAGDVAVISTCCVTNEAVAKSRKAAARAARTHTRVYLTGCAANLQGAAFAGLPDNVVVVAKPAEETPSFVAGDVGAIGCVQADARLDRVRAFVKIQDGCSFSCNSASSRSCAARRSRSADAVLAEVRRRAAQGHREVVLTGINLGCFRDRTAGYDLARLVREAGATPGLHRLRLSSIEINHVNDALISALRETPTVARHLHVPLQSGDDGVLRAMARRYTVDTYLRRLAPLAEESTDERRIVGFPRRTKQVRDDARDRRARRIEVHVFPYCRGRAPSRPPRIVPAREEERPPASRLTGLCWPLRTKTEDVVLVDRPGRGYSDDYTPWLVDAPIGELIGVRAERVTEEGILARAA